MAEDLAESSLMLADKGLHEQDIVKSVRTYARKLFAEVAVRLVAFGVDLILILFTIVFLQDHVVTGVELSGTLGTSVWAVLLSLYFAAFWTSPLHATPAQFLLGIRVMHQTGRALGPLEAIVRSVALVVLWGLVTIALQQIVAPVSWPIVIAIVFLLYMPTVTARRQSLHDYVARSVVINKRSIRSSTAKQRMREYLGDTATSTGRSARPAISKMLIDAAVLAVPLFVIITGVQVANQKNLQGRAYYAISETLPMKQQVASHFEATGRWPTDEAELGMPIRQSYPDGGYFQLEENGIVRVQFELRPEFRDGSILLDPIVADGGISWGCRTEGDIETRYLPHYCRD